ncbi:hypothetical protein AVEN_33759-1 [Araneus ventricosus]|uniref:Uncharacterized protein n=1 Tax=Araneus ventricosus TaxID=182803 RepID=A0A4Y2NB06_ARAVE|nr:hypothetical protein AVEN_33759-1 [Araneus ventricosus]
MGGRLTLDGISKLKDRVYDRVSGQLSIIPQTTDPFSAELSTRDSLVSKAKLSHGASTGSLLGRTENSRNIGLSHIFLSTNRVFVSQLLSGGSIQNLLIQNFSLFRGNYSSNFNELRIFTRK